MILQPFLEELVHNSQIICTGRVQSVAYTAWWSIVPFSVYCILRAVAWKLVLRRVLARGKFIVLCSLLFLLLCFITLCCLPLNCPTRVATVSIDKTIMGTAKNKDIQVMFKTLFACDTSDLQVGEYYLFFLYNRWLGYGLARWQFGASQIIKGKV